MCPEGAIFSALEVTVGQVLHVMINAERALPWQLLTRKIAAIEDASKSVGVPSKLLLKHGCDE